MPEFPTEPTLVERSRADARAPALGGSNVHAGDQRDDAVLRPRKGRIEFHAVQEAEPAGSAGAHIDESTASAQPLGDGVDGGIHRGAVTCQRRQAGGRLEVFGHLRQAVRQGTDFVLDPLGDLLDRAAAPAVAAERSGQPVLRPEPPEMGQELGDRGEHDVVFDIGCDRPVHEGEIGSHL